MVGVAVALYATSINNSKFTWYMRTTSTTGPYPPHVLHILGDFPSSYY